MTAFKQVVNSELTAQGRNKTWLAKELGWSKNTLIKRLKSKDWNWSWIRDISRSLNMHPCTFLKEAKRMEDSAEKNLSNIR